MKKFILLLLCLILFSTVKVICQENTNDPDQVVLPKTSEGIKGQPQNDVKPKRLKTGVDLGTSFIYSKHNFFGPSYYIAPHLTYQLTPRFLVSGGAAVERSTFYPLYQEGSGNNGILPMTRIFLYGRGSYMLNEKLTLSGTVYKAINDVPRLSKYSPPMKYNYQGASLDLNYKITKSISFGIHVQTQGGYSNGFGYNPQSYLMYPGL